MANTPDSKFLIGSVSKAYTALMVLILANVAPLWGVLAHQWDAFPVVFLFWLENVMIGRHVRTRAGVLGAILRDSGTLAEERAIERRALELLEYVGIRARANDQAGSLPYGDQRRLEIARALATDPKLLALDEPAAGMNATETLELKKLLERVRADGTTILLTTHDMFVADVVSVYCQEQDRRSVKPDPRCEEQIAYLDGKYWRLVRLDDH